MTTLQEMLFLNGVVIVGAVIVALMLARPYQKFEAAIITFVVMLQLTFVGWCIYVAGHFIMKYW